jgi:hypothetical protein
MLFDHLVKCYNNFCIEPIIKQNKFVFRVEKRDRSNAATDDTTKEKQTC